MIGRMEMVQGQGIISESNVLEVLCKPVNQIAFHLADVLRRAETAEDSIDDVSRSASERVIDVTGMLMSACGVWEVRTSAAVWAGAGEQARL